MVVILKRKSSEFEIFPSSMLKLKFCRVEFFIFYNFSCTVVYKRLGFHPQGDWNFKLEGEKLEV